VPHVVVAVLWSESKDASRGERKSLKMCHLNVRKAPEASLDIKGVIYQTSCFSKTIVMKTTPPSIH